MPPDQILAAAPTDAASPDIFRGAMARLGAAVTIISTDGALGQHGLTASAVCSVTDTPPTLLVCVNSANRTHSALIEHGVLAVNILADTQRDLALLFASSHRSMDERFAGASWTPARNGTPLLDGALANIACSIRDVHEVGTHSVLFCTVDTIRDGAGLDHGLAWFDRQFHTLPRTQDATT